MDRKTFLTTIIASVAAFFGYKAKPAANKFPFIKYYKDDVGWQYSYPKLVQSDLANLRGSNTIKWAEPIWDNTGTTKKIPRRKYHLHVGEPITNLKTPTNETQEKTSRPG